MMNPDQVISIELHKIIFMITVSKKIKIILLFFAWLLRMWKMERARENIR